MLKRTIIAAILATTIPAQASAEISGREMMQKIDEGDKTMLLVLYGYANGAGWSNTLLQQRGDAPLYCEPQKLAITVDQIADILRQHLKKDKAAGEVPAGLAMLIALMATFPCA